ncbi:MAG TPA: amylo-alpha-1,6-glucosidase [Gemmatimonadaceae bacterium]|nr:amylo-alpha-1,6-glucosidase [Gemmatimonadaceae bacterium]
MTITNAEWLETDGLGGFASGRADGVRTRRYHALLLAATTPPTGRVVLVNGVDASVREGGGDRAPVALTSQRYAPDVTSPGGASRVASFTREPWPTWTYRLPSGREVIHELVVSHGAPLVALSWRLAESTSDDGPVTLTVRPFLSGRDAHATHHENGAFDFEARVSGPRVTWRPYAPLPAVVALASGGYRHDPQWYRNFQYDDERDRGLDFTEDLASPGEFTFDLTGGARAVLAFGVGGHAFSAAMRKLNGAPAACWEAVASTERARRAAFPTSLHRAADAYVVKRGEGKTVVAGYPWFSDWGRDTFVALRGLCIAGGRTEDARGVLLEWSRHVSEGMLPNYFPEGAADAASAPNAEYNAVDASLWYVVAVHELLRARAVSPAARKALLGAVEAIVAGYAAGTRFGIRADAESGLLAVGAPGAQLTWMDAKIGDWVVTPRGGKPVEVQALWINALRIAAEHGVAGAARWAEMAERAQASFAERFWNEAGGCLYDVVDTFAPPGAGADHVPGGVDASFRPNQIFAVGGLPYALLDPSTGSGQARERARRVVDAVEARLWTPAGPRSLAPGEPGYAPHYGGDMRARDAAYHRGTVWPWLAGAFIEAWVRVRGGTPEAKQAARERFLVPLLEHYAGAAPGHIAELADAEPPHAPGGCPFQAWSVGEALRVTETVLRVDAAPSLPPRRQAAVKGKSK